MVNASSPHYAEQSSFHSMIAMYILPALYLVMCDEYKVHCNDIFVTDIVITLYRTKECIEVS